MQWRESQKHCLNAMGITLWQSKGVLEPFEHTQAEALQSDSAIEAVVTERDAERTIALQGKAERPFMCLVLQSPSPAKIMIGQNLLKDTLHYCMKSFDEIAWVVYDPDQCAQLSKLTCPIWPQTEKIARQLQSLGMPHLPSMAMLLSHPENKKILWQQLRKFVL